MGKLSYVKLLKEAITDWDTSKQVDIKGPFLDPILSYKGDSDLPTHKDAASILERYYFGENDSTIMVEAEEEGAAGDTKINDVPSSQDSGVAKEKDQAETDITEAEDAQVATPTAGEKKEEKKIEKQGPEVTKEQEEAKDEEAKDEDKKEDKEEKPAEITEQLENAIIEKLIEEMELKEEEVPGDKGEGTQAAGTGDAEKQIPDRKDVTNEQEEVGDKDEEKEDKDEEKEEKEEEVEEAFRIFKEQIEAEEAPADDKKKDDEVLDIDKELDKKEDEKKEDLKEQNSGGAVPGGPTPHKKEGMDKDELEEAYHVFKEVVEEDDVVPVDSKKVRV